MSSTSHSLLDQIQAKGAPDGLAWRRWHAIYEPLVQGWLRRHRLVPSDQDDVVQEAMGVVVRRMPEFQHNGRTGAFRNWLKTIAINCLRDHWKDRRNRPEGHDAALDDWADDQGELGRLWDLEHDRHVVQKLLALLRPEFAPETWAAFERVALEGRPAAEVAAELKTTTNAVYVAKSRVLTRLRHEAMGLVDDVSGPS